MSETANRSPEVRVPLRPDSLDWALRRVRVRPEALAKAIGVSPARVQEWLKGEERPTYLQAWSMALRLHVPLSTFLLPPPQETPLPIKDFRRRGRGEPPSLELLEAVYDAKRKQAWWRERRRAPLPYVGSASLEVSSAIVAEDIQRVVPVQEVQANARSWGDFLKRFAEGVEAAGVLVLRQSYVGTNTRRGYDRMEFSGFALVDSAAPVVFVNAQDPLARQTFTIAHELAHVWLGQEAVDGPFEEGLDEEDSEDVEQYCDQVAASLLMPEEKFRRVWVKQDTYGAAQEVAKHFRVSAWAALRRALELDLIDQAEYRETLEGIKKVAQQPRGREGGGNFWATMAVRNSPAFTRALREAVREGEVDFKEAASLLNVRLSTFMAFLEREGRTGVPD